MNRPRKQITVDAEVAAALRRLAIGELRNHQQHPNGDITFEIDHDVEAEIERMRQPGESDCDVVRRMIEQGSEIRIAPRKPN